MLINRHNNKYSYTHTSDDNLLKNIELFDKLSLRFSGRILFIKDVIGSNEICCWSFYGNGRKVAEVCCTSIVYATDKKHTKVEFPEARIYEETLQVLLYEDRNAPDPDLLQATSSYKQVGAGSTVGAGFQSIVNGAQDILLGAAKISLTGGVDNMSMSPFIVRNIRFGAGFGVPHAFEDSLWVNNEHYLVSLTIVQIFIFKIF